MQYITSKYIPSIFYRASETKKIIHNSKEKGESALNWTAMLLAQRLRKYCMFNIFPIGTIGKLSPVNTANF